MFFVQDYRDRIKEENPDVSFGETGKLLGAKWKEMDATAKKVCGRCCRKVYTSVLIDDFLELALRRQS
jgi:hypothetical protein